MVGAEWSTLRDISQVFAERVSKVFIHVGNFCLAANSAEDVHEMLDDTMRDSLSVEDRHTLADTVFQWCEQHRTMVGKTVRGVTDKVRQHR